MTSLPVARVREEFAAALRLVHDGPVEITRHGVTVAVMMDPAQFERWADAVEELDDIRAADAAREDSGPLVPWEEVKRDLGLA